MQRTRIYALPLTVAPARGKLTSAEATAKLNAMAEKLAESTIKAGLNQWPVNRPGTK